MLKGEVWWAELPEPLGLRPVVLLSRNEAYQIRNSITIAEITTRIRGIPVEVLLGPDDGLPKKCVANLDTIATIRKDLLKNKITLLSDNKINQIDKAIKFAFAIL